MPAALLHPAPAPALPHSILARMAGGMGKGAGGCVGGRGREEEEEREQEWAWKRGCVGAAALWLLLPNLAPVSLSLRLRLRLQHLC